MNKNNEVLTVVGLGSSAGGLEALKQFFKHLPTDINQLNCAFVVVQHLSPNYKSMMVELLAKETSLVVKAVENSVKIIPGHIYVTPPDRDILINEENQLLFSEEHPSKGPKPSIDLFMGSLAQNKGENAIGIILSGTGHDGTEGCRAIRQLGGLTFAQDPSSAKFDSMPMNAIEEGTIDFVLLPEEIGKKLVEVLNNPVLKMDIRDLAENEIVHKILQSLHQKSKIDFSNYKSNTVNRRIAKRLGVLKLNTIYEYYDYIERNPDELTLLLKDLLIGVTEFFRDFNAYQKLSEILASYLRRKDPQQNIRVWSVGCSTGEEAYSLAIMFSELMEKEPIRRNIQIFATDVDIEATQKARIGQYKETQLAKIPNEIIKKYFFKKGDKYEVAKSIREMIVFSVHNIAKDPPFAHLDLITCRNLLIYFQPELQQQVLMTFHNSLNNSGILFIGKSDSIGNSDLFASIEPHSRIYRAQFIAKRSGYLSKFKPINLTKEPPNVDLALPSNQQKLSIEDIANSTLAQRIFPHYVVINQKDDAVYFHGSTNPFFSIQGGIATFNIYKIVNDQLQHELRSLIYRIRKENNYQISRIMRLNNEKNQIWVQIAGCPIYTQEDDQLTIISFIALNFGYFIQVPEALENNYNPDNLRIKELEYELVSLREHLQAVIEQLESANEELQSTNEELQSANEELQSSIEELETTNEELQSTNEELQVAYSELKLVYEERQNQQKILEEKQAELEHINSNLSQIVEEQTQKRVSIERKMMQQEVDLFKSYISQSPVSIALFDNQLNYLAYSDRWQLLFGLQIELIGKNHFELIPNLSPEIKKLYLDGLSGKYSERKTTQYIDNNKELWLSTVIKPWRNDNLGSKGIIVIHEDVSVQKKLEHELFYNYNLLNSIISNSPDPIFVKDINGKYQLVNEITAEVISQIIHQHLTPSQIVGRNHIDLLGEEQGRPFSDNDEKVIKSRKILKFREEGINTTGQKIYFDTTKGPIIDNESGEVTGVWGIARDVTLQVNYLESLEQDVKIRTSELESSKRKIQLIIDNSLEGILICDQHGKILSANGSLLNLLATDIDQITKLSWHELLSDQDQKGFVNLKELIRHNENKSIHQVGLKHLSGKIIPIEFSCNYQDQDQQEIVIFIHDISDRLKAQLEQKVLAVTFMAQDAIIIADANQIILNVNSGFELLTGYTKEEVIGKHTRKLQSGYHNLRFYIKMKNTIKTKGLWQGEIWERHRKGNLYPAFLSITSIKDSNGNIMYYVAIIRDLTEQKRQERNLIEAKKSAESNSIAKSSFISNMSHEIRTPLNAIINLSTLLKGTRLNNKQADYLSKISSSSQLLLAMLNDVLDYSSMELKRIELEQISFNLSDILLNIENMFIHDIKNKGLEYISEFDKRLPQVVIGDPIRLGQILANLLGNSLKFTPSGKIEVKVYLVNETRESLNLGISVTDTGIGISEDKQAKIFQAFSQADVSFRRKYGGSGLGLAIVSNIVKLMHGEIKLQSKENQGSCFEVRVQLAKLKPQNLLSDTTINSLEDKHQSCHLKKKLLVVDDNSINLFIIKELLHNSNLDLDFAEDGELAINKVKKNDYAAILMDIQMPILDGLSASKLIRQLDNAKNIPIIAMTAGTINENEKKSFFEAGINDFIAKPFEANNFKRKLCQWLDKDKPKSCFLKDSKLVPISKIRDNSMPKFELIDLDFALEVVSGNFDLLYRLLYQFKNQLNNFLEELQSCLQEKNYEHLKFELHSLKGASANLGITELSKEISIVEKLITTDKAIEIDERNFKKLNQLYYQLIKDIALADQFNLKTNQTLKPEEYPTLEVLLAKINSIIESDEAIDNQMVRLLLTYEENEVPKELLKNLSLALYRFDYNEAKQLLIKLNCLLGNKKNA